MAFFTNTKKTNKDGTVLSVHSSIFYHAPYKVANALHIANGFMSFLALAAGFLTFVECAQTYYIPPWTFLLAYSIIQGVFVLAVIISWLLYFSSILPSHMLSARHIIDVTLSPSFNIAGYIMCVWALAHWLQLHSTGISHGIAGSDPNPADANIYNNPLLPSGSFQAYTQWYYVMLLFTVTGLISAYLGTRFVYAHVNPEATKPHTVIVDK